MKRKPNFENVRQIFDRVKENVRKRTETPDFVWGIKELDRITHGIMRGKTNILAGRTSEGKSTLAIQTAIRNADAGNVVAYFSLEDDREQLVEKIFCCITGANNQELKKGRGTELMDNPGVVKILENMPLLVMDEFGYEFNEIGSVVQELDPKPDMIIIDYIQMIEAENNMKRFEAISEFARKMHRFAKKENIGVILVSQINREGAREGRPKLHHLAQSGTLEQVADSVILMYLPAKYDDTSFDYSFIQDGKKKLCTGGMEKCEPDYLELEVAKNKTGPIGMAVARFVKHCYQLEDWDKAEAEHRRLADDF